MPAVSVIIPTYNRAERLVRAVDSVLSQSFQDLEIIVVDDGSIDGTEEATASYGRSIKCIRFPANRGVSAARNAGIRASKAEWLGFLDSDDWWLDEKLETQMAFVLENPDTLACQTQEIWIRNGRRVNPQKKHRKPSGDIFEESLKLCLVSPSSVILRKSLLKEIGLFDETMPAAEDYDLWLRISCRYPIYLIDRELVVKEGGHEDQLSRRFMGIDRFRIRAMVKLIQSGNLSPGQMKACMDELKVKCRIYGKGCGKRGKAPEGSFYLSLPEKLAENQEVIWPDTGASCDR